MNYGLYVNVIVWKFMDRYMFIEVVFFCFFLKDSFVDYSSLRWGMKGNFIVVCKKVELDKFSIFLCWIVYDDYKFMIDNFYLLLM